MTYRVEVSRRAAKAVTSLDKPQRRKVLAAIDALSGDPRSAGGKKLADQQAWRIRVGDYRIIYEIHDQVLLILVVDVGQGKSTARTCPPPAAACVAGEVHYGPFGK